MPFVAGNFSADAYNKAKITMAQLFGNNSAHAHLRIPSPVFKCIAENQNISLRGPGTVLANGRRCEGLDVSWLNVCDLSVDECANCELDGDELGAQSKTYINNLTFCKTFKVKDGQCQSVHEYNEKIALALLALRASLDQELERRAITFLNSNADDLTTISSLLPVGAIDNIDDTLWNIPAAEFKAELFLEFEKLLQLLNIPAGRVIDGTNFYNLMKIAKAKMAANQNCCTTDALYELLPVCQDIRNVDTVSGENRTFLIDSANVAYFNTVVNPNTSPIEKRDRDNTQVWSIPSLTLKWKDGNTLKPVMYDIKAQYKCDSDGNGHDYVQVFQGEHRGAFILGPSNCADRHGIIKIASVTGTPPPGDGDGDGDGGGETDGDGGGGE